MVPTSPWMGRGDPRFVGVDTLLSDLRVRLAFDAVDIDGDGRAEIFCTSSGGKRAIVLANTTR